jgi:type III secretion protein J
MPRARSTVRPAGLAGLACLALVAGCAVPVAGGLDEGDANRIVVALDRAAIDATKEADPAVEGKFRVMVTRDDASRALGTMRSESLPRPHAAGVLDSLDKGALVPSTTQEHAQLVSGMAGDLARTLEEVDGVLSARVHLNVAAPDPLRIGPAPRTTASVLLEHRGVTPPITESAVARLIAGGVPDLAIQDVAVVWVARPAPPPAAESELRHVGPIAVAQGSMRLLQLAIAGLLLVVTTLAAATLLLFTRVRRLQREAHGATQLEAGSSRSMSA